LDTITEFLKKQEKQEAYVIAKIGRMETKFQGYLEIIGRYKIRIGKLNKSYVLSTNMITHIYCQNGTQWDMVRD
jgi:hypothetical protein